MVLDAEAFGFSQETLEKFRKVAHEIDEFYARPDCAEIMESNRQYVREVSEFLAEALIVPKEVMERPFDI